MPQHAVPGERGGRRDRSGSRLYALDGLRFCAALAVVLYHLTARFNAGIDGMPTEAFPGLSAWTRWGSVGVQLFFVISGFVILLTAWRADLPSFAASRVSRLMPAYWVSVLLNALVFGVIWRTGYAVANGGAEISSLQVLVNLTMVQSAVGQADVTTSYWTLWPELLFYLGVAVMIRRGITANRVLGIAVCWPLLGLVARQVPMLETLMVTQWSPFFAGGMALFLIYRGGHAVLPWLVVGFNTVVGAVTVIDFQARVMPIGTGMDSDPRIAGVLGVLCFGAVALVTVTPLARTGGRWLAWAGALTYPLYLMHEAVGWSLLRVLIGRIGPWAALGVAVGVALVLAALIHLVVEQPFAGRLRSAALTWMRAEEEVRSERRSPVEAAPVPPSARSLDSVHESAAAPAQEVRGAPFRASQMPWFTPPLGVPRRSRARHAWAPVEDEAARSATPEAERDPGSRAGASSEMARPQLSGPASGPTGVSGTSGEDSSLVAPVEPRWPALREAS